MATAQKQKYVNVPLADETVEKLQAFRRDYEWTQKDSIELGVQALAAIMELHELVAEKVEPEIAELYRRVAREMPAHLVEPRPKADMQVGWTDETKETPAVRVDGWYITAENDHLEAVNDKGQRGRVRGGVVVGSATPSPKKAVLKPVT